MYKYVPTSEMSGRCCKHQIAVYKFFREALTNLPPVTAAARYEAACVALGSSVPTPPFYCSLAGTGDSDQLLQNDDHASINLSTQPSTSSTGNAIMMAVDSDVSEAPDANSTLECSSALQAWRQLSTKMEETLTTIGSDSSDLLRGLERMQHRLDRVTTHSQLCSFFNSSALSVPRRYNANSMIRTQPTAAS